MKLYPIFALALVPGLLASCTKDPLKDLTVEDSQVYITNHDPSTNFQQFKTFSILDSVLVIGNQGSGSSLTDIDIKILTSVVLNMEALGYTYVSPTQKPDLGINVAQVRNAYLNVVSQPISPYLGSYWGGYGYGYGYSSTYSYYQTKENYWYLEMLDFKNPDIQNKQVSVIWNAEIRGNGLFDLENIDNFINSVFKQSSYLKLNK